MPFDNISTWVWTVYTNEFEILGKDNEDDAQDQMELLIYPESQIHLKDWIFERLNDEVSNKSLLDAILSSIDLKKLQSALMEWMVNYKQEKEDKDEECSVCSECGCKMEESADLA